MATEVVRTRDQANSGTSDSFLLKEAQFVRKDEVVRNPKNEKDTFLVKKIQRLFGLTSLVILEGKDMEGHYRSMTLGPTEDVFILS